MGMHGPRGFDVGTIDLKDLNFSHLKRTKEFLLPFIKQRLAMALVGATAYLGLQGPVIIGKIVDIVPCGRRTRAISVGGLVFRHPRHLGCSQVQPDLHHVLDRTANVVQHKEAGFQSYAGLGVRLLRQASGWKDHVKGRQRR